MENQQLETSMENEYLKTTLKEAEMQHRHTRETIEKKQNEMIEFKKDIFENTEHQISNLWSSEGFEALAELSQSISPVTNIVTDCEEMERKLRRLENLIKSPYFARIDFLFEDDETPEKIYIGRTSLLSENSINIYVYDWRSPIASVFYRFMTGKATYDAPAGKITGEILRKRQYEIKDSQLRYFFDTDMNISDEILKQMLSQNTSPKMKSIVETIQKEQDIAIRNMENDLLMIQGVAGSGKTSIALHRAAYLMYQGLQTKLNANNILIISPNTAFEQYISNVLPELGEENVVSMVFEDMISSVLKDRAIQPQNVFLEQAVTNNRYKKLIQNSMKFKTSLTFLHILDQFVEDIPQHWIHFQDIYVDNICIAEKEDLKKRISRRPELPLSLRLEQLETQILEEVFPNRKNIDKEKRNSILQELQSFTKLNIYDLYQNFWETEIFNVSPENSFMENIEEIREYTLENLASNYIFYDDAVAILYLHIKIYGNTSYQNIRQVIIDEAQDYYPLQFEIFHQLFPNAKYTVLGDINQTLAKQENISFYHEVQNILKKKNSSLIALDKSFRCTNEVLQFSLQFISHRPEINSFNRAGENVDVRAFQNHEAYLAQIVQEIKECMEKGFESICLICKTDENCSRLFSELQSRIKIQHMKNNTVENMQGCFIIPSYMTKGMEFDAVIICDTNAGNYYDEDDRKLLYIECTRALHRLSLYCEGELSPLLL